MESIKLSRRGNRLGEADAIETARWALMRLPLQVLTHGTPVRSLAVLGDGRLASGGSGKGGSDIKIWSTNSTGDPVVLKSYSPVSALTVFRYGWLASGDADGAIKVWSMDGTSELGVFNGGSHVSALTMFNDGRLVSGGDREIWVWPKDGTGEPVVLNHGDYVRALALLDDAPSSRD